MSIINKTAAIRVLDKLRDSRSFRILFYKTNITFILILEIVLVILV